MDAVRSAIRELGGDVVMSSERARARPSQIRLPLTLAIMPALLVESDATPFAIPLERVERTVQPRRADRALGRSAGGCSSCATACCR